jgi:hypothetical protein
LLESTPPPSILKALQDGIQFHNVSYYKWDVFSLGVLVLQSLGEFEIVESLYENELLDIDTEYLAELILKVPRKFRTVVTQMLDIDDNSRPDWI